MSLSADLGPLGYKDLSPATQSLWAKVSDVDGSAEWLPLSIHHFDTVSVIKVLWDRWLSISDKKTIQSGIYFKDSSGNIARKLAVFLAGIHDIGKASPIFQYKNIFQNHTIQELVRDRLSSYGLIFTGASKTIPHSVLSEAFLEEKFGIDRSVAVIVGGHHGKPPDSVKNLNECGFHPRISGWNDEAWEKVREEIFRYALSLSDLSAEEITSVKVTVPTQVLLTGLLIMSDWISSNSQFFPYEEDFIGYESNLPMRIHGADVLLDELVRWKPEIAKELVSRRFGFKPRPFQESVEQISFEKSPSLMIIEAQMGEGKTEAALAAAEILAAKYSKTGIMFALPTQATADGLLPRIYEWIKKAGFPEHGEAYSIYLAHGKSRFNDLYRHIPRDNWNVFSDETNEDDSVIVKQWFTGRKKGLLADFVVGTIDQVLMVALKQKHLAMRHLGLSNKVVIIDECHAYDAYMGSYLATALSWLGSYNVPVILLSATLNSKRKYELVEAYKGNDYTRLCADVPSWAEETFSPLITTYSESGIETAHPLRSGRDISIGLRHVTDEELFQLLSDLSSEGGHIGIILNTVKRAQDVAHLLAEEYGWDNVHLLHSRFIACDRSRTEVVAMRSLACTDHVNRGEPVFVVGTQVMEQSLDLDFDALLTDICPIDLLIQRMGRLHRHSGIRRPMNLSSPVVYIIDTGTTDFEKGAESVYGGYQLYNTRVLLNGKTALTFPEDIAPLVHAAYDGNAMVVPADIQAEYNEALRQSELVRSKKENKAVGYQIDIPRFRGKTLLGWLKTSLDSDENQAVAAVRDTYGSVEVIVLHMYSDGSLHLLPWVGGTDFGKIDVRTTPPDELASVMAECKLSLPGSFTYPGQLNKTIEELEKTDSKLIDIEKWYSSPWLKGELFLILNQDLSCELLGKSMFYDQKLGLR